MLNEMRNTYREFASIIPNWEKMTKDELANGYIHNEDNEDLKSAYFSALILQYWYMIPKIYEKSVSMRLTMEDAESWLVESIQKALRYRPWSIEGNKLYATKDGATKTINRCIDSVRLTHYQHANHPNKKLNYMTYSLDESISIYGDSAEGLLVEDDNNFDDILCESIVTTFLKRNRIVDAIILDAICTQDVWQETSKNRVFKETKLATFLQHIDSSYINYFYTRYNPSVDIGYFTNKVKEFSSKQLKTIKLYIKKTLSSLQTSREVKELLCL